MFDALQMAPPDPILGLTDAFNKDPNPNKINLSVGVYKDAAGKTPILASVKEAERRLLDTEKSKSYRPIDGAADYNTLVQQMLFGADHEAMQSKRAASAHTPGGTAALRVAGDFLRQQKLSSTIWLPDPTWANHAQIFQHAGLKTATYAYFDPKSNALAFDAMLESLAKIPAGDTVLLHGCCQNPTGADPTVEQWTRIGEVIHDRKLLPLVDFAYQGFAEGLAEDARGLHALMRVGGEMLICSSFSKNFGLYNERVGALTVVADDEGAARVAMSHIKIAIRGNYSNPPAHGGSIVATVLGDPTLRHQWEDEVKQMRDRINGMRKLFVEALGAHGVKGDYSFIMRQKGMFSFSGLTKDQVQKLRDQHAIYIVGSGRINVAGMTESNMDQLCSAIVGVM